MIMFAGLSIGSHFAFIDQSILPVGERRACSNLGQIASNQMISEAFKANPSPRPKWLK
jgi:hypothetical protein